MDDMHKQPNTQISSFPGNKQEQHGFPASKWTKILGTLVCISGSYVNKLASPQDEHEIGDMGGAHIII